MQDSTVSGKGGGRIQSVARALKILDLVADRGSVRAQEAASALGLNLTTTVHLFNTLVESGYLTKQGRVYCWSADKVVALYGQLAADMRPSQRALDALHQLAKRTGESCYISCWTGRDVMIVAVAEGSHPVRFADLRVGLVGDVHARSSGKCLLAFGPNAWVEGLLAAGPLRRLTPATIVEPDALREELAAIRERGYSIDREEFIDGVWGFAAPLREPNRPPIAALTVAMPAHRVEDTGEDIAAAVCTIAADASGPVTSTADDEVSVAGAGA